MPETSEGRSSGAPEPPLSNPSCPTRQSPHGKNAPTGPWCQEKGAHLRVEIDIGDLVLTPAKGGGSLIVGWVIGTYRYVGHTDTGYRHVRDVEWQGVALLSAVPERARSGLRTPLTLFRPGARGLLVDSFGMAPPSR